MELKTVISDSKMVAIVDYGLGNLGSIANMLKVIGEKSVITANKDKIAQAKKAVGGGKITFG